MRLFKTRTRVRYAETDATGIATYHPDLDWVTFENRFRGWGVDGSSLRDEAARGDCSAGTCHIWDWSASSTTHASLTQVPCPNGDSVISHTWSDASSASILRCARELVGDGEMPTARAEGLLPIRSRREGDVPGTHILRATGPRGDHEPVGLELAGLVSSHDIVPDHRRVRTELPEVLGEVVGERVVVVDHENHGRPPTVPPIEDCKLQIADFVAPPRATESGSGGGKL